MKTIKKKYTHYVNDEIDIPTCLDNEATYKWYVVYFINCLINDNYFDWLTQQLQMVYEFDGTVYVMATLNKCDEANFRTKVLGLYPNVIIECNYDNEYEYPGILKAWELGRIHNNHNDIILYFHAKGLSRERAFDLHWHHNLMLADAGLIKEVFTIFPTIDKVGYFASWRGWIWYNFWFARGSYIYQVEKPVRTERRHYYECWLARAVEKEEDRFCDHERPNSFFQTTLHSCYGIYTDRTTHGNIGSFYDPTRQRMESSTAKRG